MFEWSLDPQLGCSECVPGLCLLIGVTASLLVHPPILLPLSAAEVDAIKRTRFHAFHPFMYSLYSATAQTFAEVG